MASARSVRMTAALLVAGFIGWIGWSIAGRHSRSLAAAAASSNLEDRPKRKAPELDGGIAWLNTANPLKIEDFKGRVVLLDFWTLCCINCIHVMPDLAKLEARRFSLTREGSAVKQPCFSQKSYHLSSTDCGS